MRGIRVRENKESKSQLNYGSEKMPSLRGGKFGVGDRKNGGFCGTSGLVRGLVKRVGGMGLVDIFSAEECF